MNEVSRDKPLLVFDGDCSFCRLWIDRWKSLTGELVGFAPYQSVLNDFPDIPPDSFKEAVQLIEPGRGAVGGAHAVFRMLEISKRQQWLTWVFRHVPGFAGLSEAVYRYVAARRVVFYKVTRLLWGESVQQSTYYFTRGIFLRGMGVIYLIAFLSLSTQVLGLIGSNGILPAQQFLESVRQQFGGTAYWSLPTLTWFNPGDGFLQFLCVGGVILSVIFIIGFIPKPVALLLWAFYFSLFSVGQQFLSFQWDILLLEAGFLIIFFAPLQLLPGLRPDKRPSVPILWLLRLLLFRLVFQSGVVKLTSGDPSWLRLTALTFHYETQCIPTPLAWYAYQLPLWFQQLSVLVMFFIEIVIPILIFLPRRPRMLGAWLIISFQILIFLTGNYGFFNVLTIVLCLTLFDDAAIRKVLPWKTWKSAAENKPVASQARRYAFASFIAVMLLLNVVHLAGLFINFGEMPGVAATMLRWSSRYAVVNSYGLFRVMTTTRPEIIVEGSNDGEHWSAYEFRYKPGDTLRAPPWVAPHQPRLDWQMWFAALGNFRQNRWFVNFMARLLEGSSDVRALLQTDPFPNAPPRYVRASLYEYHFTNAAQRRATGAYWRRTYLGVYLPPIGLRRR